jgi:hypothetical protein
MGRASNAKMQKPVYREMAQKAQKRTGLVYRGLRGQTRMEELRIHPQYPRYPRKKPGAQTGVATKSHEQTQKGNALLIT